VLKFPAKHNREFFCGNRELFSSNREFRASFHSADFLGLRPGAAVTIRSPHDFIPSIVEADDTLRRKVIAMTHAFGGLIEGDHKFTTHGSSVARLMPNDFEYDPITGIPRMSNIPVNVTVGWAQSLH
jgi:hypothetical protein